MAEASRPAAPPRTRLLPWVVAAALAVVAAALSLLHFRESSPEQRVLKYSIPPPEKAVFDTLAISPDGRRVAFTATESGTSRLWVRQLDSLTAQPLAGTEGANRMPFWSPDSRFIAFFAEGKLKKIDASGGPPQALCDVRTGRGGAWNRDGTILFHGLGTSLTQVSAEGGEAKLVGSRETRWPVFLPDGRHYLYTTSGGIYAGALNSKETSRLLEDPSSSAYVATSPGAGYLLFWRGGSLMAQPFDSVKLRLTGGPFPIAENVGYRPATYSGSFSASENGVLVYDSAGASQDDELVWVDRTGKRVGTAGDRGHYTRPALSPDEKLVAVDRLDPQARADDIWLIELERGVSTRFTFDPKDDFAPIWSPDGRSIVFASRRDNAFQLYRKVSSGAGKDELLLKGGDLLYPSDWSPDGRFLLYHDSNPKTKFDMWLLPDPGGNPGDRKPMPFLQTEFNELRGAFSPDGKWIAYDSDESGRFEVYVQTFPVTGAKWQVSKGGGTNPKWRSDGKELLYLGADRKMTAVAVKTGGTFQVGNPQPLFETRFTSPLVRYAMTRDGQRFLVPTPMGEAGATSATVVINWMAGIKR